MEEIGRILSPDLVREIAKAATAKKISAADFVLRTLAAALQKEQLNAKRSGWWQKLSAEERSERARKASLAHWKPKRP